MCTNSALFLKPGLLSALKRFYQSKRANVTVLFALSSVGLTLIVGTALDMGRINDVKKELQNSADSAVLRALTAAKISDDLAATEANKAFLHNFEGSHGTFGVETNLTTQKNGPITEETFHVTAKVPSLFGGSFGQDHYNVGVVAKAQSSMQKVEIALVLDVTGSMASDSRITNLKSSVDTVLASLLDESGNNTSGSQIAIVPFNKQVKITPSTSLSYIDYGQQSLSLSCKSGFNANLCQAAWDVRDKVCLEATNMDDCRSKAKGYSRTTTSSGRTYYYVTYKSYQGSGSNYRIFTYNQVLYVEGNSNVLQYYSHLKNHYNATSISFVSVVDSGYSAIASNALTYTKSYATGYGATPRREVSSITFGQPRTSVYAATTDAKASWTGCLDDRTQSYDVSAEAPQTGITQTLYPAVACANTSLLPLKGLSPDIATARSFVQSLQTGGNTNITIGVQWGMEVLSPSTPYGGGVTFEDDETQKFMIIVTDGDNTQNRWTNVTSAIDARTALACQAAKDKGITLYVLKVMQGNSNLLRDCASKPEFFYDLSTASQLNGAMNDVFESISQIRLTQ